MPKRERPSLADFLKNFEEQIKKILELVKLILHL